MPSPMTIGDFFKSATHGQPVNPKPVKFIATSSSDMLPGGVRNPAYPGTYKTRVTACFAFFGGDVMQDVRDEARRAIAERARDERQRREGEKDPVFVGVDPANLDIEILYQTLFRALHSWDDESQRIGAALYPTVKLLRETVVLKEANRLYELYQDYVASEHKEETPAEGNFPDDEGGGEGLAPLQP